MTKTILPAAALLVLAIGFAGAAHAALLVYDGFPTVTDDPPPGDRYSSTKVQTGGSGAAGGLGGQNPTVPGFSSSEAWSVSDHALRPVTVLTSGLSYPELPTADGMTYAIRTGGASGGGNSNPVRIAEGGTLPSGDFTRWVSFLIKLNLDDAEGNLIAGSGARFNANFSFDSSGDKKSKSLIFSVDVDHLLTVSALGGGSATLTATPLLEDETNMIVARIAHSASTLTDTIATWVNPTLSGGVGGMGVGTAVTGQIMKNELTALRLEYFMGKSATETQECWADEIRIGTEALDVGVTPEPATVALMALAALVLARRRD